MTPRRYIINSRVNRAKALLIETNASVGRIAEMLGYDSIHYFSKQFAQYTGRSPSAYRSGKERAD